MECSIVEKSPSSEMVSQLWDDMASGKEIDGSLLRVVIKESWERSRNYGIRPYEPQFQNLPPEQLPKLQENKWLLKSARSFIKNLYAAVADSGFVITLSDSNGWVLELLGDPDVTKHAEKINMIPGSNWSEQLMGSNGMGICAAIKRPVQVTGAEHYLKLCHAWTCSAAPLIDSDGQLIGVLNMSSDIEKLHPHTLGMVMVAGQAISCEVKMRRAHHRFYRGCQFMKTVFDTVSEGLILVDQNGSLRQINDEAKQLLHLGIPTGAPLPEETRSNLGIDDAMTSGQQVHREVAVVSSPAKGKDFLKTTITPVVEDEAIIGAIAVVNKIGPMPRTANPGAPSTRFYFEDILGQSPSIRRALHLARAAAKLDANILLVGESGTGKEMFAQAIHHTSQRSQGAFVAVNCASIPRELAASEFFGYSEGAFTGARRNGAPGKFELADGGTLFLDEIGDMPLEQQALLLRVLEEKQVTRVGGNYPKPVDVRVIAATNQDLSNKIAEKGFRSDLYYRLNVLYIEIPPLRERTGDIRLLAQYFTDKYRKQFGINTYFTEEAFQAMEGYEWPGNVRELQNVVQQAIFQSSGRPIGPKDLPFLATGSSPGASESLLLKEAESMYIRRALEASQGDIAKAAELLGISKTTLYRRLKANRL